MPYQLFWPKHNGIQNEHSITCIMNLWILLINYQEHASIKVYNACVVFNFFAVQSFFSAAF